MGARIVCAACRNEQGTIVCGPRHMDQIMWGQIHKSTEDWEKGHVEQGFVDQRGNYLTREEAWVVASAAGQIIRRVGGDTINGGKLFSENLY